MIQPGGKGLRAAAAAAAVALAACGDTTGSGGSLPDNLVGTWVADQGCVPNCGFTLALVANPADTLNVTQLMGIATEIQMTRQGRFTLITRPTTTGAVSGTARSEGSTLIVTGAGTVDTMDYAVAGGRLDLRIRRIYELDINGTIHPARARGIFVRQ